ncbi:MAG: hypothetical protein WA397_16820 [Roseiarcus sp.]
MRQRIWSLDFPFPEAAMIERPQTLGAGRVRPKDSELKFLVAAFIKRVGLGPKQIDAVSCLDLERRQRTPDA